MQSSRPRGGVDGAAAGAASVAGSVSSREMSDAARRGPEEHEEALRREEEEDPWRGVAADGWGAARRMDCLGGGEEDGTGDGGDAASP